MSLTQEAEGVQTRWKKRISPEELINIEELPSSSHYPLPIPKIQEYRKKDERLERSCDRSARPGRKSRLLRRLRRLVRLCVPNSRTCVSAMSRIGPSSWKRFRLAEKTTRRGLADLARAIPVEQIFSFTPESLTEQMKEATAPFVGRMSDGTFHVRLERRGLPGQVMSRRWNAVLGNTCWNCRNSR